MYQHEAHHETERTALHKSKRLLVLPKHAWLSESTCRDECEMELKKVKIKGKNKTRKISYC